MANKQIPDYLVAARAELQRAEDELQTLRSQRENPGNAPIYDQLDSKIDWQLGLVRECRENAHFDWDDEA